MFFQKPKLPRCLAALLAVLAAAFAAPLAVPLAAQERSVPYWASLRVDEVNMRVGPSASYPIDWVYQRQGLPVKVVRVMHGWRLVEDPDGAQGWMVGRLLTLERRAIVSGDGLAHIRAMPEDSAELRWSAEQGVIGKLGNCREGWCEFDVDGRSGWVRQERLWGAGEP